MKSENLKIPIRNPDFETLSQSAYAYLNEQQEIVSTKYNIHGYENWFYDDEKGLLTFSDQETNEIILEIEYEQVGSISKISDTWLWSWANPYVDQKVKNEIETVRQFGIENKFEHLTKPKWNGDQYDGWEMTAIAALLMNAKGAYRFPLENTYSFVIYKRLIDEDE